MSCAPLQLSDEDEHRSGDVLLGDEIAPEQLASVERSTILLKEYDFLPRELYLVVDSRPGASGSCQVTAAYRTFWLIARIQDAAVCSGRQQKLWLSISLICIVKALWSPGLANLSSSLGVELVYFQWL